MTMEQPTQSKGQSTLSSPAGWQDEAALWEALVASLSDMGEGLMIIENRRFTLVNQAICAMSGYSAQELLAMETFVPIFYPDERERVLEKHIRRISGEHFDTCYETAFLHRDGHRRIDVEMSVWPAAPWRGHYRARHFRPQAGR